MNETKNMLPAEIEQTALMAPVRADIAHPATNKAPMDEGGMQILQVLHSLRRQWLAAVVLGVMCGVPLTGVAWLLQKPKYTSSAYLQIAATEMPLVFETAENSVRNDFKTFKNTQRQLMLTPFVLNKAMRREGLTDLEVIREEANPIEWLQGELKVDFPGDAEIVRISLTSGDRNAAQRIVNAVVGAYTEEVVESARSARVERLNNLERVYNEAESKARMKRSDLRSLAETLGTTDSDTLSLAQQGSVQHYGLIRNELAETRFKLMRAEGELAIIASTAKHAPETNVEAREQVQLVGLEEEVVANKEVVPGDAASRIAATDDTESEASLSPLESPIPQVELDEIFANDAICRQLKDELDAYVNAKYALTEEAFARYEQTHADRISSVTQQLEERREHLRALMSGRIARGTAGGSPTSDTTAALQFQVGVLRQQEKSLAQEVSKLEDEVRNFGRSSVDVEMMRTEIEGLDAIVRQVGSEIERTKVELKGNPRITVLSKADAGAVQDKKRTYAVVGMVGMLGLVFPGGLLVWRDVLRKHVNNTVTARDELGLAMLGAIPRLPRRIVRTRRALTVDAGYYSDQLRDSSDSVAAMIMRRAHTGHHQVLLISSAMPREGKSSLTCHLASSLARAGFRIVVVDFDLRRPTLHRVFERGVEPGVGNVLDGSTSLAEAIQPSGEPGIDLLSAGTESQLVARCASSGMLQELFSKLRQDYDFVLVDAGPVLSSPDTRVLSQPQFVDGVILSVLKDVSQVSQVEDAKKVLQMFGSTILGTVLTGCTESLYYSARGNG